MMADLSSSSGKDQNPLQTMSSTDKFIKYKVSSSDTLTSIAARFDCLPTEIMKANRLPSRQVFSDQVLLVPDRGTLTLPATSRPRDIASDVERGTEAVRHTVQTDCDPHAAQSDLPGDLSRGFTGPGSVTASLKPPGAYLSESEGHMKYVKIRSRHITDGQGVVVGILLVTPNCVMFDPNVSDPLVLEHGVDRYGVIVPMDNVVTAAIYRDIAHMRVKDRGAPALPNLPPPEVYYPSQEGAAEGGNTLCAVNVPVKCDAFGVPDPAATLPSASTQSRGESDDTLASCSPTGERLSGSQHREHPAVVSSLANTSSMADPPASAPPPGTVDGSTSANVNSGSGAPPVPRGDSDTTAGGGVNPAVGSCSFGGSGAIVGSVGVGGSGVGSGGCVVEDSSGHGGLLGAAVSSTDVCVDREQSAKQKVWKRFSHPLTWMETLSGSQDREATPASTSSTSSTDTASKSVLSNMVSSVSSVSNALVRRSSSHRRSRNSSGFSGYRNLVTMEEKESLFSSLDRLVNQQSVSHPSLDDSPLYLCLTLGKRLGRRIKKSVRILTYGERKLRSELWFSVPREKCSLLYNFFQYWTPEVYGSLDSVKPTERGFELVDSDTEIWEDDEPLIDVWGVLDCNEEGTALIDLPKQLPKQSWNGSPGMSEELRKALASTSLSSMDTNYLPELNGSSEILTIEHRQALAKKLPPRVEGSETAIEQLYECGLLSCRWWEH